MRTIFVGFFLVTIGGTIEGADGLPTRQYDNRLTRLQPSQPILGNHREFIAPIEEVTGYEAPVLVDKE